MFEWKEEYEVGHEVIDKQHKFMMVTAQSLLDAMRSGDKSMNPGETVDLLLVYASKHFITEEQLMRECSYPDLKSHIVEHERFAETALKLKADIDQKPSKEAFIKLT